MRPTVWGQDGTASFYLEDSGSTWEVEQFAVMSGAGMAFEGKEAACRSKKEDGTFG